MKRLFDIAVSAALLLMLSPVLTSVWILVRVKLGAPALFKQERPGLRGRIFTIYKFRSMRDAFDAQGKALPDAERLTAFGKALRSSSLDELPELLNVLRGDMSLVGPRPLLVSYLPLYSPRQVRRHEVRPGLTGLAQVSGRNGLSWDEKFELDVWYVEHQSMWLDLKILVQTAVKVLSREDVAATGHVTMPAFLGNGPKA